MSMFTLGDALLIVDPQNDFFSGGALAVPEGDQIIPVLNDLIQTAVNEHVLILISRDWHPANHCSFKKYGGTWPLHCIQNTFGAKFHSGLTFPDNAVIINKAFTADFDAYSAFQKGQLTSGELFETFLEEKKIKRLWIGGLALDYCVKATALDAKKRGYAVEIILPATKAIALETGEQAIKEMERQGIQIREIL
jgi:nicotinamidase/pyrazinamidase